MLVNVLLRPGQLPPQQTMIRPQTLVMLKVEKPWTNLSLKDGCKLVVLGVWVFRQSVGCGGEWCGRTLAGKTSLSLVLRRWFLTTVN